MDLQSDRVVLRKVLYLDIKWVKEEITIREIVYTCSTSLRRGLVSSSVWTTYGFLLSRCKHPYVRDLVTSETLSRCVLL